MTAPFRQEKGSLSAERLRELLRYDPSSGIFYRREARAHQQAEAVVGTTDSNGYVRIMVDGRRYLAHRLAWFYVHSEWPPRQIDHIDSDRGNNALQNLRLATPSQNRGNSRRAHTNRSGFKGVSWNKRRGYWQADICVAGKKKYLGRFDSAEKAHAAYIAAATDAFGDFARPE